MYVVGVTYNGNIVPAGVTTGAWTIKHFMAVIYGFP